MIRQSSVLGTPSLARGESQISESQRPSSPVIQNQSSHELILPPSIKDFSLPLKPFRIPFLHTHDARNAVVVESLKFKRPSTASSIRSNDSVSDSSRTLGIRAQVGESRSASAVSASPSLQARPSTALPTRPSTALSQNSSVTTARPKSAGLKPLVTTRNRSLTDLELDRIEVERKRLDDRLISMKGILNDMNAQSKFMDEELKRLAFQSTVLDKDLLDCDADAENKLVQSLYAVQTKTEYWIQSVKEEELYKQTLSLIFERNSTKSVDVEAKISTLQSELSHYQHDLHVMSIRLHQAKLEQSASEKFYQSFATEISDWREQRNAQLSARSKQVSDIRRETAVSKQSDGAVNLLSGPHSELEPVSTSSTATDVISKRTLQEGMLQMKRLTQQETPQAIVASYTNCIERTQMFLEEQENMKQRISDGKLQQQKLSKELELLKYGGDDMDVNADLLLKTQTAKTERKCAESTALLSNAEMQFTSLKTGLQNLQNRLQHAPHVNTAALIEQETQASSLMASIGNISCLGLHENVVKECVRMMSLTESKTLHMIAVTQALLRAVPLPTQDLISQYRNELYVVDATARPHNVRVLIESPRSRRQRFYQDQQEAQQHMEAEKESMRVFRSSLKNSSTTAEKKGVVNVEAVSAPTKMAASTSRRATIA